MGRWIIVLSLLTVFLLPACGGGGGGGGGQGPSHWDEMVWDQDNWA